MSSSETPPPRASSAEPAAELLYSSTVAGDADNKPVAGDADKKQSPLLEPNLNAVHELLSEWGGHT